MDNFFLKTLNKNEKKDEKIERIHDLVRFCAQNGNPINIIDYGGNFDQEEADLYMKLGLDNKDYRTFLLGVCMSYLNGLIFTDSFEKNEERNEWKGKMLNLMDEKIKNIYKSNRLIDNTRSKIVTTLNALVEETENFEMKEKLQTKENKIKNETWGLVNKMYDPKSDQIYGMLSNKEKIEIIKKFSEIVKEIIDVLETKS